MRKFIFLLIAAAFTLSAATAQELDTQLSQDSTSTELQGRFLPTRQRIDRKIGQNKFVYKGEVMLGLTASYGTLKSEIERIQSAGRTIVFDIDVKGGLNLKRIFGDEALAIFIAPPSVEELSRRLHGRGDTSEEMIQKRLAKAEIEMADAPHFDKIIINDDLATAKQELDKLIQ